MTAPDNFIRRWARLKRASDSAREAEAVSAKVEVTATQPAAEGAADPAFDPASLPSLEQIAADTDIGAFLKSGVPAELTRAALRRAWASDPAIRDFIGIAENQWDFTDPNGIPGFGPLRDTDNIPMLVAQALGQLGNARASIEKVTATNESSDARGEVCVSPPVKGDGEGGQEILTTAEVVEQPPMRQERDISFAERGQAKSDEEVSQRRSHGGALPR
jgi:hypothetical protein